MGRARRRAYALGRSIRTLRAYPRQGETVRKSWSMTLVPSEALHLANALLDAVLDGAEEIDVTVFDIMLSGGHKTTVTSNKFSGTH
jgi:hypothetical protein